MKPLTKTLILFFLMQLAITFSTVFRDALFLSTYPPAWFSYLYLVMAAVQIAVTFLATPLLVRFGRLFNLLLLAVLLASGLLVSALPLEETWTPFIVCLYLTLLKPFLITINSNSTAALYTMRELKEVSPYCQAAANVGAILSAYSIPLMLTLLPSQALYQGTMATLVLMLLLLLALPVTPSQPKRQGRKEPAPILSFPLLRTILLASFIIELAYVYGNYSLRFELSLQYTRQEISYFLGWMLGATYLISFLIQMLLIKKLIHRQGVPALFLIAPVVIGAGAVALIAQPSLATAALFFLCTSLAEANFGSMAIELALNALPTRVRLAGKFFERGVASPLGYACAAVTFLTIAVFTAEGWLTLLILGLLALALAIFLQRFAKGIHPLYFVTLKEAVQQRTLAIDVTLLAKEPGWRSFFAEEILQQPNPILYPIAFSLLREQEALTPHLQTLLLEKSLGAEAMTRLSALNLLRERQYPLSESFLLGQFAKEEEPELLWAITILIAQRCRGDGEALPRAKVIRILRRWLSPPPCPKSIFAAFLFILLGDLEEMQQGLELLHNNLKNKDEAIRSACVHVLGELPLGNPLPALRRLLHDKVVAVRLHGIEAVMKLNLSPLIPEVIKFLGVKDVSYHAVRALQQFGVRGLPFLLPVVHGENYAAINAAVRIIAAIGDESAKKAIVNLGAHPNSVVRSWAASYALSQAAATAAPWSSWRELVRERLTAEASLRNAIKGALLMLLPRPVVVELQVKIKMATARLLAWYGLYTQPRPVSAALNALMDDVQKREQVSRRNKALEMLDSLAHDRELREIFVQWDKPPALEGGVSPLRICREADPFLDKLCGYAEEYKSEGQERNMDDITSKLLILREVKLFAELPGELLYAVAKEIQWRQVFDGELLFREGDAPDGLYVIASGTVAIERGDSLLTTLHQHDFFGEVGVINNSPRLATAVAHSDGALLFIDTATFDALSQDFPQVLRAVTSVVITYLQRTIA